MTLLKSLAHHKENVLLAYIRMATTDCPLKAWVDEVRSRSLTRGDKDYIFIFMPV